MSTPGDAERLPSAPHGVSLRMVIDARRRLDELSTARVVGTIAESVHKAQHGGVALGMLSPLAIVVRPDGSVTLDLTSGTSVAYSAPERLRGAGGDRRSDVFALGVILWEALAHQRLFGGSTDDEMRAAVLDFAVEFRPPSECNANVPPELDAICKKALARDPADRYQSAKVMAAEISAVLDDSGYADNDDQVVTYLAAEFPSGPVPSPPVVAVAGGATRPASKIGATTSLGMAPAPEPTPIVLHADRSVAGPGTNVTRTAAPAAPASPAAPTAGVPRPKTPTPLPAWAMARPAASEAPPSAPLSTLRGVEHPAPPAAVAVAAPPIVDAPPSANPPLGVSVGPAVDPLILGPIPGGTIPPASAKPGQTAILGSLGADPEQPPQPSPLPAGGANTAILGSNALDEVARLAAVRWHDTPLPRPPPPAPAPLPPPTIKPTISTAETMPTPALGHVAGPSIPPPLPVGPTTEHSASRAGAMPAAGAPPDAEGAPEEPPARSDAGATPHPAEVVALPRAKSRGDQTKGDMLGGWGWGTDSHEAIDEDLYEDTGRTNRRRLILAIGGAGAAVLLVTIVAFAFGGSKHKGKTADKQDTVQKAATWDQQQQAQVDPPAAGSATEPPKPEPAVEPPRTEPAAVEPPRPEPVAVEPAAVEPPKPEPAAVEPPKPEPPKPEPPKPEPPKAAKAEPPKPAKAEPPKPEPPKPEPPRAAKPEPKVAPKKVVARRVDKKATPTTGRPIDPYATLDKKVDPNAAYRTGFQQYVRGDSNGALATFKASLTSNPGFAPTWRGIGLVYEKLGKRAQARTAYRRYLQLSPGASDADQIRERLDRLP